MRNFLRILSVVAMIAAVGGCSSQRMQLSKNEPPKNVPKPEERVRYGFPWSKPKTETAVATKEIPPEIAEQLAKSKTAPAKTGASKETLHRAAEAEARGDLDAARAAYLDVVSTDPKNVEAHHRLGVIADMRQDPQSADQHYAQAYAANRRDADLLCDMGYSLYLRGRFEESERRLKEALEVNAYHRAALSNLGLVYGKQGRYDDALAMFRQAGTETEAQRNIAQLFPNGKPGGKNNATMIADASATPFPMAPAKPQTTAAPPMPPDIDQRLVGLATDSVQPGGPMIRPAAPQAQTLAQLGNLQPSLPGPTMTAQPAVAAKPQGSGNPWVGSLDKPLSPQDVAAMSGPPQQSQFAPPPMTSANPFPMSPGGTSPPTTNPMTNAASWPSMDGVSPANFQADGSPYGIVQASAMNPADASRWAAQMAMGAGPGSMIPQANAMPQASPPSGFGSSMPNAINPGAPTWSMPNMATPPTYGNAMPFTAPPTVLSNLNIPSTWTNERSTAAPVEAFPQPSAQPPRWAQPESLAPASPWDGSNSPAVAPPTNWMPLPSNPPTNTANGFNPNAAMNPNAVQPPHWPPAGPSQPTSGASSWPVIQPGTSSAAPSSNGPMMPSAASGPTTVPNWPYAPSRPN